MNRPTTPRSGRAGRGPRGPAGRGPRRNGPSAGGCLLIASLASAVLLALVAALSMVAS